MQALGGENIIDFIELSSLYGIISPARQNLLIDSIVACLLCGVTSASSVTELELHSVGENSCKFLETCSKICD